MSFPKRLPHNTNKITFEEKLTVWELFASTDPRTENFRWTLISLEKAEKSFLLTGDL